LEKVCARPEDFLKSFGAVIGNTFKNIREPECGPMSNVMAALPNIGGAVYSMPQSLADAHY